jgi:ABC-type branched-subunit amino acid transport system ATPase component
LDEPTPGLAPVIPEQLSKAMDMLRQSTNITILQGEQNVTLPFRMLTGSIDRAFSDSLERRSRPLR